MMAFVGACLAGWPDHPRRAVDQSGRRPPAPTPPCAMGRFSRSGSNNGRFSRDGGYGCAKRTCLAAAGDRRRHSSGAGLDRELRLALFPRRRVSPRVGAPALVHPVDCWCSMGALKKKCSACKPDDPHSNHRVPPSLAVISVPADTLFQVNLVIHGRTVERRLPRGRCQPVRPTSSAPACGSCAPLSTAWLGPEIAITFDRNAHRMERA
jgi:hypothetical protein